MLAHGRLSAFPYMIGKAFKNLLKLMVKCSQHKIKAILYRTYTLESNSIPQAKNISMVSILCIRFPISKAAYTNSSSYSSNISTIGKTNPKNSPNSTTSSSASTTDWRRSLSLSSASTITPSTTRPSLCLRAFAKVP